MSDRFEATQRAEPFESPADLEAFFQECDALEGPALEPDWDEHLEMIAASRSCHRRHGNLTATRSGPD